MRYVITRGRPPKFYVWSDAEQRVEWTTNPDEATVWSNRRTADQVARVNGGRVIEADLAKRSTT